jgi:hypothetical protein
MGIYKTAVSKELKIRIEKIQDNLSNVKGRPQDARMIFHPVLNKELMRFIISSPSLMAGLSYGVN